MHPGLPARTWGGRLIRWTTWTGAKLYLSKLFRRPRLLQKYPVKIDEGRVLILI